MCYLCIFGWKSVALLTISTHYYLKSMFAFFHSGWEFLFGSMETRSFHCCLAILMREYLSNSNIVVCLAFQFADYCWLLVCLAVLLSHSFFVRAHLTAGLVLSCETEVSFNLQIITITVTCTMPNTIPKNQMEKNNIHTWYSILFSMNWKYVVRLNIFLIRLRSHSALVVYFFH